MNILDKMHVENQRLTYRRPEDPHGVEGKLIQSSEVAVAPQYNGYTFEQAYRTELKFSTMWYANDAQFSTRYDVAKKEILHYIYGPIIQRLNEIRARAYDRDYREVLRVVDELQKELLD